MDLVHIFSFMGEVCYERVELFVCGCSRRCRFITLSVIRCVFGIVRAYCCIGRRAHRFFVPLSSTDGLSYRGRVRSTALCLRAVRAVRFSGLRSCDDCDMCANVFSLAVSVSCDYHV